MSDLRDRRSCRCTGLTNPHCAVHGTRGLRIGIDVHAAACVVDPHDVVVLCRCGLIECSWEGCLDEARRTLDTEHGLFRVCGEHHLLFDLELLETAGEVSR